MEESSYGSAAELPKEAEVQGYTAASNLRWGEYSLGAAGPGGTPRGCVTGLPF